MPGFFVRLVIAMLGLWLASAIVPGVVIDGVGTLVLAALLMGIVNAFVRPVLVLLTLPLTVVTLGLFLLVVNAAMFGLVAALLPGFSVSGFWAALLGTLVVGATSAVASWNIGSGVRRDVLVVKD
ncbi:MAG: phage holin family protein [Alphaproteobacteria bacterium]|nr:phage holin family protein [Alphaproteobacteria bacterium]